MIQSINIYNATSFYIIKNQNIFFLIFNKNLIFKFNSANNIWIDLFSKSINIFNNKINIKKINLFFFYQWYFLFSKIKFTGKGFKIKKTKKKNLQFFFYHSHINVLTTNQIILKKLSKAKIIILTKNLNILKATTKKILNIKPINIYTKRGLRPHKVLIKKRTGKKTNSA